MSNLVVERKIIGRAPCRLSTPPLIFQDLEAKVLQTNKTDEDLTPSGPVRVNTSVRREQVLVAPGGSIDSIDRTFCISERHQRRLVVSRSSGTQCFWINILPVSTPNANTVLYTQGIVSRCWWTQPYVPIHSDPRPKIHCQISSDSLGFPSRTPLSDPVGGSGPSSVYLNDRYARHPVEGGRNPHFETVFFRGVRAESIQENEATPATSNITGMYSCESEGSPFSLNSIQSTGGFFPHTRTQHPERYS